MQPADYILINSKIPIETVHEATQPWWVGVSSSIGRSVELWGRRRPMYRGSTQGGCEVGSTSYAEKVLAPALKLRDHELVRAHDCTRAITALTMRTMREVRAALKAMHDRTWQKESMSDMLKQAA